jgi:hypothetical protein
MEAQHRIAEIRISTTEFKYGIERFQIYAWHTNSSNPSLAGSGYYGIEIVAELFAIQMTMCIYKLH